MGTRVARRPALLTSLASSHTSPLPFSLPGNFSLFFPHTGPSSTAHTHHYFCLEHSFLANPLFPIHFTGLTLEVSSSRKPPNIGPLQYGSDPPLRCTSKGILLSPPPSLLGVAAALLPAVPSRGQNPSPLCSALGPTPLAGP